jgi:chromosome segregation and condensation protein ScpB
MKKTYAGKRLLEHGPLTRAEFREITGWKPKAADRVLDQLVHTEVVCKKHVGTRLQFELRSA